MSCVPTPFRIPAGATNGHRDGGRPAAVLFDYHQTLFAVEDNATWIAAAAAAIGRDMSPGQVERLRRQIDDARSLPQVLRCQAGRDRSPCAHRVATTGWLRSAGVDEDLTAALYDRLLDPVGWHPYPDAVEVLRELARRGIPAGILSNTGWDLRETFRHYGLDELVTAYVLSCEHGIEKPDPACFEIACRALSTTPAETLMVGDNPETDGGAVHVGVPVYLVPPEPRAAGALHGVLRLLVDGAGCGEAGVGPPAGGGW